MTYKRLSQDSRTAALALIAATALLVFTSHPSVAQVIDVEITEGTNMAVALSPDGETIAMDALGRIWVLPADGGEATPLTDPFGDARQPAWSPNGEVIAFQAYWDGNYHVWTVRIDGSELRQITRGPYDHREPAWSPDGASLAFSSDREGSYDIWELALESGDLTRVTTDPGSEYGPAFSPHGRIAYARDGDASGIWVDTPADRHAQIAVTRADQINAPAWSHDGLTLSYNSVADGRSRLHVVSADATAQRVVSEDDEDVFPFRASWSRDGSLLYTSDGVIRRRDGSNLETIPFSATVTLDRLAYERRVRPLEARESGRALGIVSPAVSPDGQRVAFSALGDLWIHTIGGDTERLTNDPWIETDPAWSPDGSRLAFSTDRGGTVDLWIHDFESGETEAATEGAGATLASWSPDGGSLAFVGSGYQVGVQVLDLETGAVATVRSGLNGAGRPTWSPDGEQIGISAHWPYSARFREGINKVLLMPARPVRAADAGPVTPFYLTGRDDGHVHTYSGFSGHSGDISFDEPKLQEGERFLELTPHASVGSRGTDGPAWSPDGRWMAFVSAGVLWATPMDESGEPAGPPRRLTNEAADDPSWTGDSQHLVYLTTDRLRRVSLRDGRIEDIDIDVSWTTAPAPERVLVRAGTVFDGRTEELQRDVDIVIEDGRIVEIAPRDPSRTAPTVVDASDQFVMPGLIEMHMHGGIGMGEQHGRTWLAYGVTGVRCPACDPYELTEVKEATAAGQRAGPRWFGTGGTIDGSRIYYPGAPSLTATAQVDLELERAEALGYDLIKTYVRLSDPVQRRVIEDAHAMGLPVTSHELYPAVAVGADGVEHVRGTSRRGYSTKITETFLSYGDVIDLLAASGMTITPTVGIYGAYALLMTEDPSAFDDDRVRTFFPWAPQAVRPPEDRDVARRLVENMSSLAYRVAEAGGTVVVGTDSPIIPQGLSLHAEMEALVRYGQMSPMQVLRSATFESGRALGYEGTLGVVAEGAIADLIVLDDNPLDDIKSTRTVRTVLKGGRVMDGEDLLRRPR